MNHRELKRTSLKLPDVEAFKNQITAGFSDFFEQGQEVYIARAPGRLDVMGGIADYSGSVVMEGTLARAVVAGFQKRNDRQIRLRSLGVESDGLETDFRMSLDQFYEDGKLVEYPKACNLLRHDPKTAWAAYVAGAFFVLLKEEVISDLEKGGNIGIRSDVPLGAGVSSSAALEVAALCGLTAAYGLRLDGLKLATLAQKVENLVVGAPCGIMDQVTSTLGEEGKLLALKCQPHEILKNVSIPSGFEVIGINSNVKHSVGGSKYTGARIGAFMGHKIIFDHLKSQGVNHDPFNGYLTNITPPEYVRNYRGLLPSSLSGKRFLDRYGPTVDTVTRVDPKKNYMVRSRAEHPIYENHRVGRFIEFVEKAGREDPTRNLVDAGNLMYGSHWSYGTRCGLGSPETDLLVRLVRRTGKKMGLHGAKITGGGSGGTVAVLTTQGKEAVIEEVCSEYHKQRGIKPEIFLGTSPGAFQYGFDLYERQN